MTRPTQQANAPPSRSTEPAEPTPNWDRFDRGLRVLAITVIVVVVAGALAGVTGLHSKTAHSANASFDVHVRYAAVTRPGLATPLRITVRSTTSGPLPDTVSISIGNDYLSMFDRNAIQPTPDATTFDGDILTWTYELDNQTVLVVEVDARLQPDVHRGRSTEVAVVSPGQEPVSVTFHTRVFG